MNFIFKKDYIFQKSQSLISGYITTMIGRRKERSNSSSNIPTTYEFDCFECKKTFTLTPESIHLYISGAKHWCQYKCECGEWSTMWLNPTSWSQIVKAGAGFTPIVKPTPDKANEVMKITHGYIDDCIDFMEDNHNLIEFMP